MRTIRVLALAPDAAAPTTLLTAPDQVLAIDVADNVVASGRTRKADPPYGVGPRFWLWVGLGCVFAAAIALFRAWWRLLQQWSHIRPTGRNAGGVPGSAPAPR